MIQLVRAAYYSNFKNAEYCALSTDLTTLPTYLKNGDKIYVIDTGKKYTYNSSSEEIVEEASGGLPSVTTEDNGEYLRVVNGNWEKASYGDLPFVYALQQTQTTTSGSGTVDLHVVSVEGAVAKSGDTGVFVINGVTYKTKLYIAGIYPVAYFGGDTPFSPIATFDFSTNSFHDDGFFGWSSGSSVTVSINIEPDTTDDIIVVKFYYDSDNNKFISDKTVEELDDLRWATKPVLGILGGVTLSYVTGNFWYIDIYGGNTGRYHTFSQDDDPATGEFINSFTENIYQFSVT